MHAVYQLQGFTEFVIDEFVTVGRNLEEENNAKILKCLDAFVGPQGTVDVKKMMDEWFPPGMADVFISHARADKEIALTVSCILSEGLGLRPFVDSCVWRHANGLLRTLDETYCPTGENLFSYEGSIITASHVHTMLSTALTKMMDSCECVFFLNTENSVSLKTIKQMVSGENDSTHSPWLFHEISMMNMLRRRTKEEHRGESLQFSEGAKKAAADLPRFEYPVDLDDLPVLTADNLIEWYRRGAKQNAALDLLYEICPPQKP
jgi:hypothetical protein